MRYYAKPGAAFGSDKSYNRSTLIAIRRKSPCKSPFTKERYRQIKDEFWQVQHWPASWSSDRMGESIWPSRICNQLILLSWGISQKKNLLYAETVGLEEIKHFWDERLKSPEKSFYSPLKKKQPVHIQPDGCKSSDWFKRKICDYRCWKKSFWQTFDSHKVSRESFSWAYFGFFT